ncbi:MULTISPECIES: DUF2269 family protein [Pseudonocardia]|uniref:Integral membrane protein n=2 Tax=Pseudonocardia TaxID=1847 RepID=A0A1Y2MLY5_PSEAH|nr:MULTISPECIES: DUF2269 family protein [Pseudonocardia]OSY36250.1 hypothetical protein BG845_05500 [Pseudonocardia autotrophica]TDN73058.1 putative integral membrane protein DUF2269 [Pseudonocardia autotrophica]BBG03776.1 membrane protein [Pseudonocardia autotrophica]GEC26616.1 membrane protein [Pseudonocardia saturnea]
MGKVLLSLHVVAAIILIGPVTVAVSLFPRYAGVALGTGGAKATGVPVLLHRISRVYSVAGLSVPVLGIALAVQMGVLGDPWVVVSLVLTVAAGLVLALVVLPEQQKAMDLIADPDRGPIDTGGWAGRARRLSAASGVFGLLWVVVVVLMVVRPGSTTGV